MEGSIDRISGLPDPVLHHILSLVEAEDAIQVSAASKRLNHVWTTLPYLDMGRDNFFPDIETRRNRERFVEQLLMSRRMQGLSILRFRLHVNEVDRELGSHLDRWLQLLVESNINQLSLENRCNSEWYDLPPIVFMATSLQELTLWNCRIPPCIDQLKLLSLRKLHLQHVLVDEETLKGIMRVCRCLEDLELHRCHGFKKLEVSGLLQLKNLTVHQFAVPLAKDVLIEDIYIETSYLEKLAFVGGCVPSKFSIATSHGSRLKKLRLNGVDISTTWLRDLISKLYLLEDLMMSELGLKAVEISSSTLKRLYLRSLFDFNKRYGVGDATIDAPNLLYFGYDGRVSSISFNKDVVVPEVNLYIPGMDEDEDDSDFCCKLIQFLHKFHHSSSVRLHCSLLKKLIFQRERLSNLVAPLPNIKHLKIKGMYDMSDYGKSVTDVLTGLVDSLLWMCPTLNILTIIDDDDDDESNPVDISMKFTFENSKSDKDECPFGITTVPMRCWRNSLTHVEYKLVGADAEVDRYLSNYFRSNAKLLKGIDIFGSTIKASEWGNRYL